MDELPRTVTDPHAWARFTLSLFPAVGGAWGIVVTLLAAVTAASLEAVGTAGPVSLVVGLTVGALVGLVCAAVDGVLVRHVRPAALRWTSSVVNGLVTATIVVLVLFEPATRNIVGFVAVVIGPAVTIAAVTYRRSPEARRITG